MFGAAERAGGDWRSEVCSNLAAQAELLEVLRKLRHAHEPVGLAGIAPVLLHHPSRTFLSAPQALENIPCFVLLKPGQDLVR